MTDELIKGLELINETLKWILEALKEYEIRLYALEEKIRELESES